MRTAFITTVYNEEKSILKLLKSLNSQSKLPDEVIITDAGSKDKTKERISFFQKSKANKLKIKLVEVIGNRSIGRNAAIKMSTNEIILSSDAGCILDKDWVKNISVPFEDGRVDVVSGYYLPVANNAFQKTLAAYTSVMPDRVDAQNFLPSSRSVAFKKSAWKNIGGYPEWLNTCEDLVFAKKLKDRGFKFTFVKNALVHWPQRKNFKEAFAQFYNYALGDGMARYIRGSTPFLFLRYLIGLVLVVLLFETGNSGLILIIFLLLAGYILWAILKNYKYVKDIKALYLLPMMQFAADLAVLSGTTLGFIKSLFISNRI